MIQFFVEGEPVPKQSFRIVEKRSGKTHGYADPRVVAWQNAVGITANQHCQEMTTARLSVELNFYLSNNRVVDLDNLSKGVLDGLKGIAFKDDSQVVKLVLSKVVDKNNPGVNVKIKGMAVLDGFGGE